MSSNEINPGANKQSSPRPSLINVSGHIPNDGAAVSQFEERVRSHYSKKRLSREKKKAAAASTNNNNNWSAGDEASSSRISVDPPAPQNNASMTATIGQAAGDEDPPLPSNGGDHEDTVSSVPVNSGTGLLFQRKKALAGSSSVVGAHHVEEEASPADPPEMRLSSSDSQAYRFSSPQSMPVFEATLALDDSRPSSVYDGICVPGNPNDADNGDSLPPSMNGKCDSSSINSQQLPWWKQKRFVCVGVILVALVVLVVVLVLFLGGSDSGQNEDQSAEQPNDAVSSSQTTRPPSPSPTPMGRDATMMECHQVDVNIAFDDYSGETSWEIQRVSASGEANTIETYQAGDGSDSHTETYCLEEGQYRFTIYDKGGDGICCGPGREGSYNVVLHGEVIAQGDEFGESETTLFNITETCHLVDLDIAFDDYSGETSWDIQRVSESGDIIVTQNNARDGLVSQTKSYCLEDGQYRFTIYDEAGDGICCGPGRQGFYNLTSEGQVIAQGGTFGSDEATLFKIPLSTSQSPTSTTLAPTSSAVSASPTMSVPSPPPMKKPVDSCYYVVVKTLFDMHPQDISWEVSSHLGGAVVASSPPYDNSVTQDMQVLCLNPGEYDFTISDAYGDGLCCQWGEGSYRISTDNQEVKVGGEFGASESTTFTVP